MTHVTRQVRDSVMAVLEGIPSLTGRVHRPARLLRPFEQREFPACCVSVGETVSVATGDLGPGHRVLDRALTVALRVVARGDVDESEDEIDALRVEIEKALARPPAGSGKLTLWRYQGDTGAEPQPTENGMQIAKTLTFTCTVRTTDTEPETNIA